MLDPWKTWSRELVNAMQIRLNTYLVLAFVPGVGMKSGAPEDGVVENNMYELHTHIIHMWFEGKIQSVH